MLASGAPQHYIEGRGFDPSQPRDDHGRWTDTGAGEGPGSQDTGGPESDGSRDSAGRFGSQPTHFERRSPTAIESGRHVAAVWSPDAATAAIFKADNKTPIDVEELTSAGSARFHGAIAAAKADDPYGAAVTLYPEADYAGMRLFVTPDGKAGFALKGDDIVSVFKHPESPAQGFALTSLGLGVQQGGRRLDAFDTVLPRLYSRGGFKAVARIPWNDDYAPEGWDYQRFGLWNGGRPDVVFMTFAGNAQPYKPSDGKPVAEYNDGVAAQIEALKPKKKSLVTEYLWSHAKRNALARLTTAQRFAVARAQAEQTLARLRAFDPNQERDEDGKWTSGGGGGGGGKGELEGYSDKAKLIDGVIHTSNVYDAVKALHEDRRVELKQPKQVSTLIKKLGEISRDMVEKGEEAPNFDLCKVTVKGTNLFCADTKGIPRIKMPQMDDVQTKAFVKQLESEGYATEKGREQSANLRATQNQLIGAKVAKFYKRIRKDPEGRGDDKRLIVSRDDYVLDGHHHWAAQVAADAEDNKLGNHKTKITRIDIGIIELLEKALKFTGGKGAKEAAWKAARAEAEATLARLRAFDPSQPRDEEGKWTDTGASAGGGSKPSGGDKPAAAKEPAPTKPATSKGKKKADVSDFAKDDVHIVGGSSNSPEKQKEFIDKWNEHIGEAPAEFKQKFLGGLPGTMQVRYVDYEDAISISGKLLDEDGNSIGNYDREIDFDDKKGVSSYFKLNDNVQGKGIGKKMLAGNIAMYQQLGLEKVEVHANIDVGGKAWAKYGYVPTEESWARDLQDPILEKIDQLSSGGGGGGGRADSWEYLSDHQQRQIEQAFIRSTRDEFLDSEIENWRESGQPLEESKKEIVDQFNNGSDAAWAKDAIDAYRDQREENGETDIPFTNEQLHQAISLDYSSRYDDGRGDLDVQFDDLRLTAPSGGPDPGQQTLPGIEPVEPHERLTEDMREGITKALDKAFDRKSESDAGDIDAPDHLSDQVEEYQKEHWDSMDERDRYKWAERNADDYLTNEDGESEGTGEMDEAEADALRTLASSSDPKALWQIADSDWGEKLLIGTDWYGEIDFRDKETMDRFNAYVAKAKK